MDMGSLMSMFGGGGPAAPAGGLQLPAAQLGAATMGGPAPSSAGFGIGQQLMQGAPGATQFAAPQTMMGQLQSALGGMTPEQQQMLIQKLGPMAAQMMQQNQQPGQPMMPMMQPGNNQAVQTQAQRGYLAQGGGIAPRTVINKGY